MREVEEAVRAHRSEPKGRRPTGSAARPSPGRPALRPAGLLELEELLSDHLDTRVQVTMGAKRGRVVIEFATSRTSSASTGP